MCNLIHLEVEQLWLIQYPPGSAKLFLLFSSGDLYYTPYRFPSEADVIPCNKIPVVEVLSKHRPYRESLQGKIARLDVNWLHPDQDFELFPGTGLLSWRPAE